MEMMQEEKKEEKKTENEERFSDALLQWFYKEGRDLPWRREKNAYYTWISEIMLQQTRVEAVKAYFLRFISRFPDVKALADAEEEEVLKFWEGLGYYSRARNLHKGAKVLMEKFSGKMPSNYAEIRSLPGIGEYTAAAISSIIFSEKRPAIDGNLLRVFSRCTTCGEAIEEKAVKEAAYFYFQEKMEDTSPGDFNQALMDLGSMVCVPKGEIACASCPVSPFCRAYQEGCPEQYPKRKEKKARKKENYTILLLCQGERIALWKRPNKGLLAGLYSFYQLPGHLSQREVLQAVKELGLSPLKVRELGGARHIFTHKEWDMIGYRVELGDFPKEREAKREFLFYSVEEINGKLSIPSASAYYKQYLDSFV